jgi:sulfide:quinone oxidoreductase
MGKSVLILGGGIGGLVAANRLRKALPREHRVILVKREPAFVFAPSLLWLMIGERTAERISRPLARLGRKGIEVVPGEVRRIDVKAREATVGATTLGGDYMVIALGAELAPETVPGLAAGGHNFYTLPGAERLRDAFAAFAGGRLVILTAAPAYKCPAAPTKPPCCSSTRAAGARSGTGRPSTCSRPSPGRWAWPGRRSRRRCARWSSRKASPTTPGTR